MIQANFTVSPSAGDVYGTEFTFTGSITGSLKKLVWNLGNNELIYNQTTFKHIYNYPGTYNISLTATDFDNNQITATKLITVDYPYPTSIFYTSIPENFANPGVPTETPFKISVISTQIDTSTPLVIDLFAVNSQSTPYEFIPNKWNFLTPTWKFLDKNLNFITALSVTPVPVYKNNQIVAVSGSSEFYFVDSIGSKLPNNNCPTLITTTLRTSSISNYNDFNVYPYPSFSNNQTTSFGLLWQVNDLTPNVIKITGNYLTNINSKQWANIKIPILLTCHANKSLLIPGETNNLSEVLFSYPETATSTFPITITLSGLQPNEYIVDEAPLYFKSINNDGYRTGGYIFTTITPLVTSNNTSIVVHTTATKTLEDINYPYGYLPFPSVWISNPLNNTLNKITLLPYPKTCKTINYYKDNNLLIDGIIRKVSVPFLTSQQSYNYSMSGSSGIYGLAIDPRKNDLIACDSELDRLYRFSNTGQLLKFFDLSGLKDFDPNKKLFTTWTWSAIAPSAMYLKYGVYGPNQLSINPANHIVTVGNFVHPTTSIKIDPVDRTVWIIPLNGVYGGPYPSEGTEINATQIFHPLLTSHISSIYYWTTSLSVSTTTIPLQTNTLITEISTPKLLTNTNHYIVSIDGSLLRPDLYTINQSLSTIVFNTPVNPGSLINIQYLPTIQQPTSWTSTFSAPTTSYSLLNLNGFNSTDPYTGFLVNQNGILLSNNNFNYNFTTKTLEFEQPLPLNIPITITQYTVPNQINAPAAYTPTYVSLDENFNIWVSLFNSVSVLKFDENFNFLFSVVPDNINWFDRAWTVNPTDIDYQSAQFASTAGYSDPIPLDLYHNDFFAKPPVAETDKDNNCWVTYANPLCSFVVKYSSSGSILNKITLPPYTMPISVAVDNNNKIWIANFHGSSYIDTLPLGSIHQYDSVSATLIKSITGINRPGVLTFDNSNNLWFTHGLNRIGYYNTQTDILSSWSLSDIGFTPFSYPLTSSSYFDFENNIENENLGGLAVDPFNRVWVVDNFYNFVWCFSGVPNSVEQNNIRRFVVRPDTFLGYYVNNKGQTLINTSLESRSAQAVGDWTGNRWFQKYKLFEPKALSSVSISAVSNPFTIEPFVNKNQLKIVNESFNTGEYLKSLALPEILQNNTVLFDQFLSVAAGDGSVQNYEDLGEKVYEKIANFVQNHGDIETCNVDQLLSIADSIGVSKFEYGASFPFDVKRMIDIGSISRKRLWGTKDLVPLLNKSIGSEYNTLTDFVTAGTKIILRSRIDNVVSVVGVPPLLSNTSIYPLSSIQLYGFAEPVINNYVFYRFTPQYTGKFIENIIDWESPNTLLQPTLSSHNDWYGTGGSLETTFRYLLTKNLFLK
jgi:hypothetical protein